MKRPFMFYDFFDHFEEMKAMFSFISGGYMKDNHTIGHNPQNVVDWCSIAGEEAMRYE